MFETMNPDTYYAGGGNEGSCECATGINKRAVIICGVATPRRRREI